MPKTFAENYLPGIPQVQHQTFGQGYGDWQQYAKQGVAPPEIKTFEAGDDAPTVSTEAAVPLEKMLPLPSIPRIAAIPPLGQQGTQQQPSDDGPENAGGIGDSWAASSSNHFGNGKY